MRNLMRNTRLLYYAEPIGEERDIDENGYETGGVSTIYGDAQELRCNVSANYGEQSMQVFGDIGDYSRTISVADNDCPLNTRCVVWFGITPSEPHNYIVVGRADSKNGVLYALREVNVE